METSPDLQIVGFGPAALGLFIAADALGVLNEFVQKGIYIYDKRASEAEWESLSYKIQSNSPIKDFLCGIRQDGIFSKVLNSERIQKWNSQSEKCIDLREISSFLKDLMHCLVRYLKGSNTCKIFWSAGVSEICLTKEHGFKVRFLETWMDTQSKFLVLATGAQNRPLTIGKETNAAMILGDLLLRGKVDQKLKLALKEQCQVIILGGSHSGFSCAGYILKEFSSFISKNQIHIVSRHNVLEMYEADELCGVHLSKSDIVNPVTGQVNKFNGLRNDARNLYREIRNGAENRIVIHEAGQGCAAQSLRTQLQKQSGLSPLIVNAVGYEPRIPKFKIDGQSEIFLDQTCSNVRKDFITGELQHKGNSIPNLFGTGLGFADRRVDGNQVGINLFNSTTAEIIIKNIIKNIIKT